MDTEAAPLDARVRPRPGGSDRRAPVRQHRDGHPRQVGGDPARPRRADLRRARPARGRPRHRQDGARADDRALDRGRRDVPHPVHARPAADGRHRARDLRPEDARVRVSAGADLRERRARRRGQPRDAEDAVGAPRGDGRAAGHGRRRDARAARPVPPARDREPGRVRGDVPAARGAARPLLPEDRARLPVGGRRASNPRRAAVREAARAARRRSSRSTRSSSCAPRSATSTSTR